MGLLWELFQEYQIGKRKHENGSLEDTVIDQDKIIAELCDFVGEMARRIDDLELQVYGDNNNG